MLNKLHNDILEYISYYLNIKDISNLKKSNKELKNIFNNKYFIDRAYQLYSKTFWKKAYNRDPILSNPLSNIENELLRIEKFNDKIVELNFKKWDEEDFYEYWKSQENYNKTLSKSQLKNKIINKYFKNHNSY